LSLADPNGSNNSGNLYIGKRYKRKIKVKERKSKENFKRLLMKNSKEMYR